MADADYEPLATTVGDLRAQAEDRFDQVWNETAPMGIWKSPVEVLGKDLDSSRPSVDLVGREGGSLNVHWTGDDLEPQLGLTTDDDFIENPTLGEVAANWNMSEDDTKEAVDRAVDSLGKAQPAGARVERIQEQQAIRARNQRRMANGSAHGIQTPGGKLTGPDVSESRMKLR